MSRAGKQPAGRFITLEGGEGAGKSTQIKLLAEKLRSTGLAVTVTREPGGSPGAEDIRALLVNGDPGRWSPMSEALLHFAARADHVEKIIKPALARGEWVLCDRFADSTIAYQGFAMGLGQEVINRLYRLAIGDFTPDLTLILDIDPETGMARAKARSEAEDRYERMGLEFHCKLREAFRFIAGNDRRRCALVDAAADPGAVAEAIWKITAERLKIGSSPAS